jgi:hypothetical protein
MAVQILRNFTFLARLLLDCMVLALATAVASPIFKPQNVLLVCTGSAAMKVRGTPTMGREQR